MPKIRVLSRESSPQELYSVEEGRLGVGRSVENTIVLQDSLVSRRHAELDYDGKSLFIRDLGGKNPIRVNGKSVDHYRRLLHGDRIAIGQTELLVEFPESECLGPLRVLPGLGEDDENLLEATAVIAKPDFADATESERVYNRLSHLYRLTERLLQLNDEEELYDELLSTATQDVGAERGFLGMSPVGEEHDPYAMNVVRFWDPDSGKEARTLDMSESILYRIQRERKAVLVRDVPEQRDFGVSVIDLKIRSFICAPIAHGESYLGLLYVDTRGNEEQLDKGDLEFVSALGRLGGMALLGLRMRAKLRRENEKLRTLAEQGEQLIGGSEAMKHVLELVERVAPREASILIVGENGTGKELIARAVHQNSARHDRPFVAVNCGAIPRHLVESELFGHEKGAFTGAYDATEGKFDLADGGTLFLDEIGEMPPDMQVKILRAVQERRFYRVGGKKEIEVNIRVISATNRDLKQSIKDGTFREDLYFRLAVVTIEVPPLRERDEDVLEIARHVLNHDGSSSISITKAARECLMKYPWPGNVRELRNVLEQAVILGDGKRITPSDLPPHIRKMGRGKMLFKLKSLSEVEKQYILRVLEETDGNKAKAASTLGISRETLYQKLRLYEREGNSR